MKIKTIFSDIQVPSVVGWDDSSNNRMYLAFDDACESIDPRFVTKRVVERANQVSECVMTPAERPTPFCLSDNNMIGLFSSPRCFVIHIYEDECQNLSV